MIMNAKPLLREISGDANARVDRDLGAWSFIGSRFLADRRKNTLRASAACGGRPRLGCKIDGDEIKKRRRETATEPGQLQREMWASFAPTAMFTTPVAGHLVKFAESTRARLCSTWARNRCRGHHGGASWSASHGSRSNARAARAGSRELSHCSARGHRMDGGRRRAAALSRRVVRRSVEPVRTHVRASPRHCDCGDASRAQGEGTDCLCHLAARALRWPHVCFRGRNSPPPPPGVSPPPHWGNPVIITERLGACFDAPFFERGTMAFPLSASRTTACSWSAQWARCRKLVESLAREPRKLSTVRAEFDALVAPYYFDNLVHQDYLLTRAQAR